MNNRKKLLFVSNSSGNRISHILDAFKNRQDLKIEVLHQYVNEISQTFITKLFEKIKFPRDIDCLNQRLLKKIEDFKPEIIYETGTLLGNTTEFFSRFPSKVISIEISEFYSLYVL